MPVLQNFEDVAALLVVKRADRPVIKDEYVCLGEACEESDVGAIGMGERELLEEPWDALVDDPKSLPTGELPEGAGKIGFA